MKPYWQFESYSTPVGQHRCWTILGLTNVGVLRVTEEEGELPFEWEARCGAQPYPKGACRTLAAAQKAVIDRGRAYLIREATRHQVAAEKLSRLMNLRLAVRES